MPDDSPGLLQVTKRSVKQQSYPVILIAGTELKLADTEPEIVLQSTCIMQMEADGQKMFQQTPVRIYTEDQNAEEEIPIH